MKLITTLVRIRLPYWLRLFLLFQAADIIFCQTREPVWTFDLVVFGAGIIMSLAFFYAIDLLYLLLPGFFRIIYVLLMSFALTFLLISTFFVFGQFGEYVSRSMLQFILNNPAYFGTFIRTYLFGVNILGFLALWGFVVWLWIPRSRPRSRGSFKKNSLIFLCLAVSYLIGLNQVIYLAKGRKLPIDTSFAVAVKRMKSIVHNGLYKSKRLTVAPIENRNSCNIILLINESFGKRAYSADDSINCPMSFLRQWTQRDRDHFFVFRSALTNSGATDVSVPSILSGVAPYEQSGKLHTMPLVWDWAKAAGYHTAFVSAQQFGWANLDDFLRSPGPDIYLGADQLHLPLINDSGIDEIAAVQAFCDSVLSNTSMRPFCAVYNSNALHTPGQSSSALLPDLKPGYSSRYRNSAMVLDRAFQLLHQSLEQNGLLDNTLIIITADHGDTDSLIHPRVNRIYNFYDEIMNIPFLLYVPSPWLAEKPDRIRALKHNESQIVANLDILPTILAAMGADKNPINETLLTQLAGLSLFVPLSSERVSIALNTNDIRQWEHEGFGIFRKDRRFVYTDIEGARYYDITADPNEETDIWGAAPSAEKQSIHSIIDSILHLKRMYRVPR